MIELIGSPGFGQIDGLGGGLPTTSKVAVVGPAVDDPDADVHFQVGNVGIDDPVVDWRGTCGNLTAAAPVFALHEGFVPVPTADSTTIRLRNLSTGGLIRARVPTTPGLVTVDGTAEISTEYLAPAGSVFSDALPLGRPHGVIDSEGVKVRYSLVDVTHPYLLVEAAAFVDGPGPWRPELLGRPALATRLESLRANVAVRLGLVRDPERAASDSAGVPRLLLVGPGATGGDLDVLAVSMGTAIRSIPMTAAMCLAAARLIPGTLAAEYAPPSSGTESVVVGGPSGFVTAYAGRGSDGTIEYTSVTRTSRVLLTGNAMLSG